MRRDFFTPWTQWLNECTWLNKAKESLMITFKMKDLGVLTLFIGIQFKCDV